MRLGWSHPGHHSAVLQSGSIELFFCWNCDYGSTTLGHPSWARWVDLSPVGVLTVHSPLSILFAAGGAVGRAGSLAGTAGRVLGLVSYMGVCMVSVVLGCAAPSTSVSGVPWSGTAFSRMA